MPSVIAVTGGIIGMACTASVTPGAKFRVGLMSEEPLFVTNAGAHAVCADSGVCTPVKLRFLQLLKL